MIRRLAPLAGAVILMGAAVAVLVWSGTIDGVRLGDRGGIGELPGRLSDDPALAFAALLRGVAIVLLVWLLVSLAITVLAGVLRLRWLDSLAQRITPALVRQVVAIALPTWVALTPAAAGITGGIVGVDPLNPVQVEAPASPEMREGANTQPVMRAGDDARPPTMRSASDAASIDVKGVTVQAGDMQQNEWIVQPGDHLWSISERALEASLGRPPTDAEIVPYWKQVIELNREALPDPDNPDLIFPGMPVALPPL